jgi:hypothetical protein
MSTPPTVVPVAPASATLTMTETTSVSVPPPPKGTRQSAPVRRPVRGIQLKPETFAQMRIPGGAYDSSGADVPKSGEPAKSSHVVSAKTANFLLQAVTIEMEEKFQPVQTFGLTYGFFFGERPHIYTFTAILVDTDDFPWLVDWMGNYEEKSRGTRAVTGGGAVTLSFEEHTVKGYIIRCGIAKNAENPLLAQLTFSMWVTEHSTSREPGDTAVPYRSGGTPATALPAWNKTDAVRRANIRRLSQAQNPGWFRKVVQTVSAVKNKYDDVVQDVENFLYGRNLTVPKYSVAQAEALLTNEISQLNAAVTVRPPPFYPYDGGPHRRFYENFDEYMQRGWLDSRLYGAGGDEIELSLVRDGVVVQMTPTQLLKEAETAYKSKSAAIAGATGADYEDTLLKDLAKTVLSRAVLLGAQVVLQGDIVAFASGTVKGTILAPFGAGFDAGEDIAAPLLCGFTVAATDALGIRTLTDSILTQVQKSRLETSSSGLSSTERLRILQEAVDARTRATQQRADAQRSATAAAAIVAAAQEEAASSRSAEVAQQEAAAEAARAEQTRQLLEEFSSQAGV